MPCYSPLTGWRSRQLNANGKRPIVFVKSEGYADTEISIPCGQCIGCRLDHSRNWAIRCMHEAQLHKNNCFVTLTYNENKVPEIQGYGTLVPEHLTKFIKRVRKKYGNGIKYYACGEYGDQSGRPHYHICFFGLDFEDKELHTIKNGNKLYTSKSLDKLWSDYRHRKNYGNFGFASIGALTFDTAAYTARYCMKKAKGKNKDTAYERLNPDTGEIVDIVPEFARMSRNPGLGKSWLEKYGSDVYPHDFTVIDNYQHKPPKYYDNLMDKKDSQKMDEIKASRRAAIKKALFKNSLARLHARGVAKKATIKHLTREI
jgi:hypothetical protein